MTKGIICFAVNNESVDYVKQARFLAKRAKEFLNLPVTIITDQELHDNSYFDKVIVIPPNDFKNWRHYHNGFDKKEVLVFKNDTRPLAYDLTPYDETIVLDTDYVIASDFLLEAFDQPHDFVIHDKSIDLAYRQNSQEFWRVSDTGIKFYWATCVFFRKTAENKIFFDLLQHIQENWSYYNLLYNVQHPMYRNDYAFSIAIHIMNGLTEGLWATVFRKPIYYVTDLDHLYSLDNEKMIFLACVESSVDANIIVKVKGTDVHVMNKFSLEEAIDV
jgi:hypothetical protein